MKNHVKIIFICLIVLMSCSLISCRSCKDKEQTVEPVQHVRFGEFTYNNYYLLSFAVANITALQAKKIASESNLTRTSSNNFANENELLLVAENSNLISFENLSTPTNYVTKVLSNYSGVQINTKYFVEGNDKELEKVDSVLGTDFKSIIEKNEFSPFSQLVAKNIIVYPELIDEMEDANSQFKNSEKSLIAPFKDVFTYHTNETGNLVIQTRDFTEIPSSVGGGIGSCYRQDTEMLYDAENKMSNWHTSLGLYSSTPNGTIKHGYILEVELQWIKKA